MQRFPIVLGPMRDATRTRQIESVYGVAEAVALAETAILMGDLDKATAGGDRRGHNAIEGKVLRIETVRAPELFAG